MILQDECADMLRELSEKINNKHHEVHTHPLLSIFKMAEVEVKLPQASGGARSRVIIKPYQQLIITFILIIASHLLTGTRKLSAQLITKSTGINGS